MTVPPCPVSISAEPGGTALAAASPLFAVINPRSTPATLS